MLTFQWRAIQNYLRQHLPIVPDLSEFLRVEFNDYRWTRNVRIAVFFIWGAVVYESTVLIIGVSKHTESALELAWSLLGISFFLVSLLFYYGYCRKRSIQQQHIYFLWFSMIWLLYAAGTDYLSRYTFDTENFDNMHTFAILCLAVGFILNQRETVFILLPSLFLLVLLAAFAENGHSLVKHVVATILLGASYRFWYARNVQAFSDRKTIEFQSQKLAQLDTQKNNFLANISHEFRTPLTLILQPLQELKAKTQQKDTLAAYDLMIQNAERLLQLVNQLLELARLENGELQLKEKSVDVRKIVATIAAQFESLAAIRHIDYQIQLPTQAVLARFDSEKLETVLINLIGNAFKFTPKKGQILVRFKATEPDYFDISIRDNGIGIPAEHLPFIFDRFYQADSSSQRLQGGTGIGLALSKELAELQNGTLELESKEGVGTAIQLRFEKKWQALEGEELISGDPKMPKIQPTHSLTQKPTKEAKKQVLLVEDNTELRTYIAKTLRLHFTVLEAGNGKEGLNKAKEHLPDLIISDVMMPEMDGFTFCEKLKTEPLTAHIPVVLLTARAEKGDKINGLETGADDYLIKPFDFDELLIRAKSLIQQRQQLRERFSRKLYLEPQHLAVNSADEQFLQQLLQTIEMNMGAEHFGVKQLQEALHVSSSQLHRKVSALTNQSPNALLRSMRLQRAKQLLEQEAGNVSEIALEVGFSSMAHFSRAFKKEFGVSPSKVPV